MTEFRRIVSYIHFYENMQKGKNTGFMKMDVRTGKCRVEVHFAGVYSSDREVCEIYSLVKKGSLAKGYFVGNFPIIQQKGEYHLQCEENQFDDHGSKMEEIEGFAFVLSGDRLALSLLRGKEPRFEEVQIAGRIYGRNGIREGGLTDTGAEKEIGEKTVAYHGEKKQQETAKPDETAKPNETAKPEEASEQDETTKPDEAAKPNETQTQEVKNLDQAEEIIPFEGVQGYQFFKITPEHLTRLAADYEIIQHNSFLLHGFYNYQYLIIGHKEKDRWILGIPGVFHEREQMMASMFGFPEFKCARRGRKIPGAFGYYLKEVKVADHWWRFHQHPAEIQNSYS